MHTYVKISHFRNDISEKTNFSGGWKWLLKIHIKNFNQVDITILEIAGHYKNVIYVNNIVNVIFLPDYAVSKMNKYKQYIFLI